MMRMWHKRESFRLFPTFLYFDNELTRAIWTSNKTKRATQHFNIFFIMIMMSMSLTLARPYNNSGTPTATISPLVELLNPKLLLTSALNASNYKERTRILTLPRRPSTSSNRHEEDEDEDDQHIVFPDSLESYEPETHSNSGTITFEPVARLDVMPDCAAGSGNTFCEDIPTYPYKLLRDVLGRGKTTNNVLFGMDETPDEIAQRIGEPEENYICGAIDKTVYPKVGKTKNNKWKYIINQGSRDGYVQGVRVETCVSMGKPCDLFGSQPNGYITSCKQKFIYRKMLSLSEGGQPIPDTFLMPSACCCSYKRDNRFLARFGAQPVTPVK